MTFVNGLVLLVAGWWVSFVGVAEQHDDPPVDYSDIDVKEFGVQPVEPQEDPRTGFVVGGKNDTEKIRALTEINGKPIAELEDVMRPGESSEAGFLGKDERLLEVMAEDNEFVVDRHELTHQELAKHLHAMGAIWLKQNRNGRAGKVFVYRGRHYKVRGMITRGYQPSPFDDGTRSGSNVTVENVDNGKIVTYGLLVPFMVDRYGFYEGHGTSYRLNPKDVVELFDFLRPAKDIDKAEKVSPEKSESRSARDDR